MVNRDFCRTENPIIPLSTPPTIEIVENSIHPLLTNRQEEQDEQNQQNVIKHSKEYHRLLYDLFVTARHRVHWFWAPAFLCFWILLYLWITIPGYTQLPVTLKISDEHCKDSFIAERAAIYLDTLTALGPRVVGSPTHEITLQLYFKQAFARLQNVLAKEVHDIEMDIQLASGNYIQWEMVYAYHSIRNIVIRLSPHGSNSTSYLLINSHYDTVPGSLGASDDGAMIAVMMETLHVLCKSRVVLQHPILFLFNGAAENSPQGAHGFITSHKWANYVKAVVNLESAGSGGREILFQSGPNHPWLMKSYRRAVKHPFASTLAEELFERDLINADTDLSVFREHGGIPGLDMAYHYNGFVYHTRYDQPEIIPTATLQHTGDNILSLVQVLSDAEQLDNPAKYAEGHTIFFDIFGLTLVFYTETEGIVLNVLVSVGTIITCLYAFYSMSVSVDVKIAKVLKRFLFMFIVQLFAVIAGGIMCLLIAILIDYVHMPMSWFTQAWLISGLYFCPLFFGYAMVTAIYFLLTADDRFPIECRVQLQLHCHCILIACFNLTLTMSGVRSAFILTITLLCYALGLIVNLITRLQNKPTAWIIPHTISCIFPFLFHANIAHGFFVALIPMMGWLDPTSNPELVIATFTWGVGILTGAFLFPILTMFDKSKTLLTSLLGFTVICIIIAITPLGFPFRPETNVQRFSVVHTSRTFHSANGTVTHFDSGYLVMPQDRRSYTIKDIIANASEIQSLDMNCTMEMLCGIPLYNHRWHLFRTSILWLPVSKSNLNLPTPIELKLINRNYSEINSLHMYELELSGPSQMSIYIKPLHDVNMTAWSFHSPRHWHPPFIVNFAKGANNTPFRFYLEFKVQKNNINHSERELQTTLNQTVTTFQIAVSGHWTFHEHLWSTEFQEFLQRFPEYVDTTSWMAQYATWEY